MHLMRRIIRCTASQNRLWKKKELLLFGTFPSRRRIQSAPYDAFSCNLLYYSKMHLRFLQQIHLDQKVLSIEGSTTAQTYYAITEESIRRYLDLWLPLVAKYPTAALIPPQDIAWLWHCHRLNPKSYENYTTTHFDQVLNAWEGFRFCSAKGMFDSWSPIASFKQLYTLGLWIQECRDDEYFLPSYPVDPSNVLTSYKLDDGFDLVASSHRQASFLWQVSGYRYLKDNQFLQDAVNRYYSFLQLRKNNRNLPSRLVPTYQIDFMWHTHVLCNSTAYSEDCVRILGNEMNHDDSLNDRTPGGQLEIASQQTATLWNETFEEPYVVEGGMYRGESPTVYFSGTWDPQEEVEAKKRRRDDRDGGAAGCGGGCGDSSSSCGDGGGCGGCGD